MGNQISWHVVLAIKQDQLDDFQALTREMVEFTRTESGVLSYQRLPVRMASSFMGTSGMRTPPLHWRICVISRRFSANGFQLWSIGVDSQYSVSPVTSCRRC